MAGAVTRLDRLAPGSGPTDRVVTAPVRAFVWCSLLLWPLGLWIIARHQAPWGDELHFLQTVRLFGEGLSLELLRTYPEMSAPLTYVVYALWGHLAGFGTAALRLLSPLVAWATGTLWLLTLTTGRGLTWPVLACFALFLCNPYVIGLSVFVFTDMLALLGLAIVTLGLARDRSLLVALGVAVATLSRQYLIFVVPAVVMADVLAMAGASSRATGRHALASVIGAVPLGLLIALWGWQLAPASPLRDIYVADGLRFDMHALSLYLAAPGAYLLPWVLPGARAIAPRCWGAAALLASVVLVAPVQASPAQLREGVSTVGFVHKALVSVAPAPVVDLVFWGLATIWIATVCRAAMAATRAWRTTGMAPASLFPWTAGLAFLAVMPFSYMPWEKYAVPLFMTSSLILLEWRAARAEHDMRGPRREG